MKTIKQKVISIIIASIAIIIFMFFVPFGIARYAPADAGMTFMLILFLIANPIFSIALGVFAGHKIRVLFFIPLLNALVFLLSVWTIFTFDEITFIIYANIYLFIGLISMAVTALIKQRQLP